MARAYRQVGTIEGIHGTRGEVRFRPLGGAANPLEAGREVVLVPPTLEDRRRKLIAGVREDRGGIHLAFSDVRDRSGAALCVGRTVLVPADEMPEGWGSAEESDLIGLAVRDRVDGDLGRVIGVEEGPAQALLVVEGPRGEVLIPAVEPIVGSVEDGVLQVDCPPGLVGLA